VGGGFHAKLRYQKSEGHFFSGNFTAEDVAAHWGDVTSFERENGYPTGMGDVLQVAMSRIGDEEAATEPKL
jgi:hypothetical protein